MATEEGAGTGLLEELQPAPYEITPQDHGGYILIAAVIMIVLSGLVVMIKLYMMAKSFRKLRRDDWTVVVALIFAVTYTVCLGMSVNRGLGRSADLLEISETRSLGSYFLASTVLLYLSLAFAKCSVALLVISIEPSRWITRSLYGVCATTTVWGLAAICVTALQCEPERWALGPTEETQCIDQYAAQIGIKLVDMLTDVVLAVLPTIMMLDVQVSIFKRFVVSFMFGIRLLVPIFTAVTLASQSSFYQTPTSDRSFAAVAPSVWTSIALNLSLITACLPALKRFLMDWGAGVANGMMEEAFDMQQLSATKSGFTQNSAHNISRRTEPRSRVLSRDAAMDGDRTEHQDNVGSDLTIEDRASDKGSTDGILQVRRFEVRSEKGESEGFERFAALSRA